eukprot:GEMP01004292.1.p1 GENE.GEMP01004292.1~~GEMP01004292.1.p1  ORF type:complete len:417 (+),score=64.14 GEMP01004292.1:118-1368(+)
MYNYDKHVSLPPLAPQGMAAMAPPLSLNPLTVNPLSINPFGHTSGLLTNPLKPAGEPTQLVMCHDGKVMEAAELDAEMNARTEGDARQKRNFLRRGTRGGQKLRSGKERNVARKREKAPIDPLQVFVGGIPRDTHPQEVRRYFEQFGKIIRFYCPERRGYCFVKYTDPDVVKEILAYTKTHRIHGGIVDVRQSRVCALNGMHFTSHGNLDGPFVSSRGRRQMVGVPLEEISIKGRETEVIVKNVRPEATCDDLDRYFSRYGNVTKITLEPRNEDETLDAFVGFDSIESIAHVLEMREHHAIKRQWVDVRLPIRRYPKGADRDSESDEESVRQGPSRSHMRSRKRGAVRRRSNTPSPRAMMRGLGYNTRESRSRSRSSHSRRSHSHHSRSHHSGSRRTRSRSASSSSASSFTSSRSA